MGYFDSWVGPISQSNSAESEVVANGNLQSAMGSNLADKSFDWLQGMGSHMT